MSKRDLKTIRKSLDKLDRKIYAIEGPATSEVASREYRARTPKSGYGDHEAVALVHYIKTAHGYDVVRADDEDFEGFVTHDPKIVAVRAGYPSILFRDLIHETSHILTKGMFENTTYKEVAESHGITVPKHFEHHILNFKDELVAETTAVVVGAVFKQAYEDSSAWWLESQVIVVGKTRRLCQALNTFDGVALVEKNAIEIVQGIREGLEWLRTEGPLATHKGGEGAVHEDAEARAQRRYA